MIEHKYEVYFLLFMLHLLFNHKIYNVMYKKLPVILVLLIGLISCRNNEQSQIVQLRQKHADFLKNSPFVTTQLLSRNQRKDMGLPPNRYMERQWELTLNPAVGRPTPEKLSVIRQNMFERINQMRSVPGIIANPWIERGPGNVGGRTKAVMFDPNDPTHKKVWAGSVSGGLWYNNDITNPNSPWHITGLPHNLAVSSIAVDPNDTQTFYVGTGESYTGGAVNGNGIWKSTDGGMTWTHVFGGKNGESQLVSNAKLTVSAPAVLQGDFFAVKAAFGNTDFGSFSGNLVLVNDGSANPTLGCNSPFVNAADINGNIAVIERGTCYFVDKVSNAENAGAIGVLMINNVSGTPITMGAGSNPPAINIPSVMISKEDGAALLAALQNGTQINVSISETGYDISYGYLVPGITHINDIITRNNNGVTEIYATAGDSYYSDASNFTLMGHGYQGVYKSVDGGQSWTKLNLPSDPSGNSFTPNDLELGADNKIWLSTTRSTYHGTAHGAVLSSSDGQNFNVVIPLTNVGRIELATSKTNPDKIYLLEMDYSNSSIVPVAIKTNDAFVSNFELVSLPDGDSTPANDFTNGQGYYDLAMEVDPSNDNILYMGGIDWFKSTNGGNSWTQITHYYGFAGSLLHPDQHGIAILQSDPSKILFANDGGVAYSSNGGNSISHRNKNYVTAQFYHMAVAPTANYTGDYFMAGAQDNGTQLFENAPQTLSNSIETQGGDGAYCFFDQDGTDKYRISNYVYNANIRLYNYNTQSWKTVNSENARNGDFINQEALDSHLNILYSNYSTRSLSGNTYAIRRYANLLGNITKTTLQDPLMTSFPTALKVSPYTTNASKLFVGLQNGKLLQINNAHATPQFVDITGNEFVGSISDIEFGQSENEILVTMFNYGVKNIFYTQDGGQTWVNKEGDLPDMPVNTILQNPLLPDEVIIGTDLGVWATPNFNDAQPNWYPVYNGMSDVKVTDLELRDDNAVFASTYGRGVFSGQFTATPNVINEENHIKLSVYPNPATDFVYIDLPDKLKASAYVYDTNGRIVLQKNVNNRQNINFDVRLLSAGAYFLTISNGNQIYHATFLVRKQ